MLKTKDDAGVMDWLYSQIAYGVVHNHGDAERTFKLPTGDYRFHVGKRDLLRLESCMSSLELSNQLTIIDRGKTLISSEEKPFYKSYIDIKFTELGESLMLLKAL